MSASQMFYTTQKGDMMRYQQSLPSLPVPPLKQTLERYLVSVRPILSDREYEETKRCVKEFGRPGGVGEDLHRRLEERAEKMDNWLCDWWLEVAYLSYRLPVPIHVSPATVAPRLDIPNHAAFVDQATRVLIATAYFKKCIDMEVLPVDMMGKAPLSMEQYQCLYSCNRIPCEKVDELRRTPAHLSLHAIVAHNGHFFKVQLYYPSNDGTLQIAPFHHIRKQVVEILEASPERAQHQVGLFTSEHRDTWYKKRQRLIKDPVNRRSLDIIEQGIFFLGLDTPREEVNSVHPGTPYSDHHGTIIANRYLHGNGANFNSGNRWFDTSVQFFLSKDGAIGSTLEHSSADGTTAIKASDFVFKCCFGESLPEIPDLVDPDKLTEFEALKWSISPETAQDLKDAEEFIERQVKNFDAKVFTFNDYGKESIKTFKMSPDAFIQQAVQLAYFRCHGKSPAVYESASTRQFKFGRTETIRSQSPKSLAFCQTVCDPNASTRDKAMALREAVNYHTWYTKEAVKAQGVDRHLLGMKLLATQAGIETPSIYTDVAYSRSLTHGLSTSQVPVEMDAIMSFGPTAESGYGVCYNPRKEKILFVVSSFNSSPETNSLALGASIAKGLNEMREFMTFGTKL